MTTKGFCSAKSAQIAGLVMTTKWINDLCRGQETNHELCKSHGCNCDCHKLLANSLCTSLAIEPPSEPLKLYIAGPMSGMENFNYEAFNLAAADLRLSGYEVLNPADSESENTSGELQPWHWYMRKGITKLMLCDAIALLDGWEQSKGATIEVNLAYNLGYEIRHVDAWLTA